MDRLAIKVLRADQLKISQEKFGQVVGVHFLTVSKWESGKSEPNAFQWALIEAIESASKVDAHLGKQINQALSSEGVAKALHLVLAAAYKGEQQ